jgi:ubiquinone/menaquinone biosynthesis C-methylase UbiE
MLDVGGGSGRTAIIASSIVGSGGRVALVDPSPGMRALAARKGIQEIHEGLAERLPVADSEFDLVVMGYMLRHVQDLESGFSEAFRALKPLGQICILEITEPRVPLSRTAFRMFAQWILPVLSWMGTRRAAVFPMMRLWADTMRHAPSERQVVGALESAGFVGVRRRCELGIFTSYRAIKPVPTSGATAGILRASWPSANMTSPEAARTSNR